MLDGLGEGTQTLTERGKGGLCEYGTGNFINI